MEPDARPMLAESTSASSSRRPQLRWRIIALLLLVSLLPLLVVTLGSWQAFGRLLEETALQRQRTVVDKHAEAIDGYLAERLRALELITYQHSAAELAADGGLQSVFQDLRATFGPAFVDLGVINSAGRHLAYVGPYQLIDKSYEDADWFEVTRASGTYVSDVFLGYRQVPHCVIAVKRQQAEGWWILRATINSDRFDSLVRTGALGETGDVYIVNADGVYQTPPRVGQVLEQSPIAHPAVHRGVLDERLRGGDTIRVTRWINDQRWMLVVQQDAAEILAPLHRALAWGGLVVAFGIALVLVTSVLATRNLTAEIERAEARQDELSRDLMRSARLASLGELATGLAHEINNPLAIIGAEQTNIGDLVELAGDQESVRDELLASVATCKRQVRRCGQITAKMLQFGRQGAAHPVDLDVVDAVDEVVGLMMKQAEIQNVLLRHETSGPVPDARIDPTELQQVLVNLINNALQATREGGEVTVSSRCEDEGIVLEVRDTGTGMEPAVLERVFQPFFTTKPVGEGTGLGLSVCFGIVHAWGGSIDARSEVGQGTSIMIRIPTHTGGRCHVESSPVGENP